MPLITAPYIVVDNFLTADVAREMRADVEAHFSAPASHQPESHQIWNYWYVPGQYTYLRTRPESVIERSRVDDFVASLHRWSVGTLGLGSVTWPYLSMYVNGCVQGLHNDSRNGRFGFVFSLTRPDRRTIGGSTIILHEGDPFRRNLRNPNAGTGLHELIEPMFNRLLVFDDRLVHGVEYVAGSMDPLDARLVLHGHIEESGPIVNGQLPMDALREGICGAVDRFITAHAASIQLYHGPLVVKFDITRQGMVSNAAVLLDRVVHEQDGDVEWEPLRSRLMAELARIEFPRASGETNVTLPIAFGGPVKTANR